MKTPILRLFRGTAYLLLLVGWSPAMAATWYVATGGNDNNPGTQGQPFRTIQRGIDASSHGDTVLVGNGKYSGVGNRNLNFGGRNITLRSQGGQALCVIDGANDPFQCVVFS